MSEHPDGGVLGARRGRDPNQGMLDPRAWRRQVGLDRGVELRQPLDADGGRGGALR